MALYVFFFLISSKYEAVVRIPHYQKKGNEKFDIKNLK